MPESLIGVWTLKDFELRDVDTGERSQPFGPEPRGVLIFHPDGRMVALLTPGRAAGAQADEGSAPPRLVAYSGPFRLEPPDRFVTAVDVAWVSAWLGTEQARTYRVQGNKLDVITGPNRMPRPGQADATVTGTLSFIREESATKPSSA